MGSRQMQVQEDCLLKNMLANRSKMLDKGRVEKQGMIKWGTERISEIEIKCGQENGKQSKKNRVK